MTIVHQERYGPNWWRLRIFAEWLGWRGLCEETVTFPDDEGPLAGRQIKYYVTTWNKLNLQINQHPIGQEYTFRATVCAWIYGIRNTPWHEFTLFEADEKLFQEATRITPMLGRKHFRDRVWRREFERLNPELVIPSKKRRRSSALN
jgi:hypothetical protein